LWITGAHPATELFVQHLDGGAFRFLIEDRALLSRKLVTAETLYMHEDFERHHDWNF